MATSQYQYFIEILNEILNEPNQYQRIVLLKQNDSRLMRRILRGLFIGSDYPFNSNHIWYRPDGAPLGLNQSNLFFEESFLRELERDKVNASDRPENFVEPLNKLLERLHPSESALLVDIITQNTAHYRNKYLTLTDIKLAYPESF